jgi:molybdopterin molybdotransferase
VTEIEAATRATDAPSSRSLDGHRARILDATLLLPAERVALNAASGRTLAVPIDARDDLPRFDNSAMDGFAVVARDVLRASPQHPVALRVHADAPAGVPAATFGGSGTAVRVMTGAPLPPGADTIVPLEDVVDGLTGAGEVVLVHTAPGYPGRHVRRRGEDVVAGEPVLAAGARMGPLQVAAAAAVGVDTVAVHARPRVHLIATGRELVAADGRPGPAAVRESNTAFLRLAVESAGGEVVAVDRIDDDPARVTASLEWSDADVVVFTGGIGPGTHDPVRAALGRTGRAEVVDIPMRPGRVHAFGVLPPHRLIFGLPGNPLAAIAGFESFVRPALLRLQGRASVLRPALRMPVARGWTGRVGMTDFVPVVMEEGAVSATHAHVRSHQAAGVAAADGLAVTPLSTGDVCPGAVVDVILLD